MPLGAAKAALFGAAGSGAVAYAGYFAGGNNGITTVDRFLFADDSRTTLGTGLSVGRRGGGCFANAGVAGYFAGGNTSGAPDTRHTTVDKFAFPDDARTTLGTGLATASDGMAGMSNSGTAGYVGGGYYPTTYTDVVEKFAFSDDGRTTLGTGLSVGRGAIQGTGMSNSGTAGYIAGGYATSAGSAVVDKFAFSDDSRSTLGTGLTAAAWGLSGFSNSGTAGYIAGGYTGAARLDRVDKFAFSDDSRSTLGTGLSATLYNVACMANSGTAGYVGGGYGTGAVSTVNKFAFSDDGRTTLGTGLSVANNSLAGFANSETLV